MFTYKIIHLCAKIKSKVKKVQKAFYIQSHTVKPRFFL